MPKRWLVPSILVPLTFAAALLVRHYSGRSEVRDQSARVRSAHLVMPHSLGPQPRGPGHILQSPEPPRRQIIEASANGAEAAAQAAAKIAARN
jgi:hypothetical protein